MLLPAFDCEATLRAALDSVQRQSEPDFECVIVDDGSRDRTLALARSFAERDARCRVIARAHAGLVESLNAGLAECQAPVIARMDGDDLMSRDRLSSALAELALQPALSGVGTR